MGRAVDKALRLRYLIYAYFFLLLYDGILRKWIFPDYDNIIMVIKQAVAVLVVFYGGQQITRLTGWEKAAVWGGIVTFLLTLLVGHGNLVVALWGCYPWLIGFPLCYIIAKGLRYNDIDRMGKIIVYTSIVNSLLIILQFSMPIDSWINYQGGEVNDRMSRFSVSELYGLFRPAGIFMHYSHSALFTLLALSFQSYFFLYRKEVMNKWMLYMAVLLLFITIPFAISRIMIFYIVGFVAYLIILVMSAKNRWRLAKAFIVSLPLLYVVSTTSSAKRAWRTMMKRFDVAVMVQYGETSTASGTMTDIYDRGVVYNIKALTDPKTLDGDDVPFWGYGQGMSTQVGGRLLGLREHAGFSLAEFDGLRIVCESGLFLGWILLFIRLGYVLRFLPRVWRNQEREGKLTAILFPSFFISFFLYTTWGNSFQMCFAFMTGGLFLTSLKDDKPKEAINRVELWKV